MALVTTHSLDGINIVSFVFHVLIKTTILKGSTFSIIRLK